MDELLEVVGSNKKYQIMVTLLLFIIGVSCEVGFIGVPVMETSPIVIYTDENGTQFKQIINYSICKLNYTILESESKSSWALDYNMFCDKFKISILGSLLCIGGIFGSAFLQYLKLKGPMFALFFSCMILTCSTFLLISNDITYLYWANFFAGVSNIMCFMLRINIMTEITGPKYRSYFNNIVLSSSIFSTILIYYLFDNKVNWRIIYFGNAIIVLITSLCFRQLTVENFRYYYTNKDYKRMIESLRYISKFNSKEKNPQLEAEIKKFQDKIDKENKKTKQRKY